MCCFSRPVRHVSKTRIYARPSQENPADQLLVYSMKLAADEDVAMVLPIPVPPSSPETAVRFVDMSRSPDFFTQVDALFEPELTRGGFGPPQPASITKAMLVVHDVGDFEASFVPTRADFDRLDPRFRLPDNVFDSLPQYADWGFCVFKLRAAPSVDPAVAPTAPEPPEPQVGFFGRIANVFREAPAVDATTTPAPPAKDYHPMAFEFPRREASRLFFPTVHVHDGVVHPLAEFDHQLYCQGPTEELSREWQKANRHPTTLYGTAKEWVVSNLPIYRRELRGNQTNADILA